MVLMLIGLILFLGSHSIGMFPDLRRRLVEGYGLRVFKIGCSLVALIGFALICYGFGVYRSEGWVQLWTPPKGMRHLALLLMLFAFIALAASGPKLGHIKMRLKHPMLVGVKTWALAHLLANGDLGGMILFLSLLAWAVVDRISYRWRPADVVAPAPEPNVRADVFAVVAGSIAYVGMLFLHPYLIGVAVLG
jgi:uncharacterized membrane protein